MSSTPTPSSSSASSTASGNAAQATGRSGAQGSKKPAGQETGADLFANLLSLLSATTDPLPAAGWAPTDAAQDGADTAPGDTGEAQLEAMMAWAALPAGGAAATGTAADLATRDPRTPPGAGADTQGLPAPGTPADELQGMQVLDRPEALDEQTLARLAATPAEAPATDADAAATSADVPHTAPGANAAAPARPGAWRSTAQMAGTTSALQQWHHTQAQAAPAAERVAVRIDAGPALPLRSTLALDQRFAQAGNDDTPVGTAGPGSLPVAVSAAGSPDHTGQSGTGGEAGAEGGEPFETRDELRADSQDGAYEEALAEADAQAEERMDSFASPHLRQASLRIGEDGENPIDVRLSLSGQELDLSFRTDSAEARAELRQHAEGTLADLLQRGGIQLGDVSVSDQGGQPGRDGAAAQSFRPGTAAARPDAPAAPTATVAPSAPRPRSDGSRPLDLFV